MEKNWMILYKNQKVLAFNQKPFTKQLARQIPVVALPLKIKLLHY
jgi:hypothetical protein